MPAVQTVLDVNLLGQLVASPCISGVNLKSPRGAAKEFQTSKTLSPLLATHVTGIQGACPVPGVWQARYSARTASRPRSVAATVNQVRCVQEGSCQDKHGIIVANSKKCDGVPTTCNNIPKCGYGASCDKKSGKCKCDKGLAGNGFQCFDATTGEPAANPNGNVEISIDTESKFFVYPHESQLFPDSS